MPTTPPGPSRPPTASCAAASRPALRRCALLLPNAPAISLTAELGQKHNKQNSRKSNIRVVYYKKNVCINDVVPGRVVFGPSWLLFHVRFFPQPPSSVPPPRPKSLPHLALTGGKGTNMNVNKNGDDTQQKRPTQRVWAGFGFLGKKKTPNRPTSGASFCEHLLAEAGHGCSHCHLFGTSMWPGVRTPTAPRTSHRTADLHQTLHTPSSRRTGRCPREVK